MPLAVSLPMWRLLLVSMLVVVAAWILSSFKSWRQHREHFSESANPLYEKEFALFQSMNKSQRVTYLNLSRDDKMAKYGSKLL
jgi:hypothetical protein